MTPPGPRVVFVEQFYYPEGWGGAQLPRDITMHWARDGYAVEVVCGSDQYVPAGDTRVDPRAAGVHIRRVPRLIGGPVHRLKLLRQLWFYAGAAVLLFLRRRPHAMVSQTNPPLVVPLVALASVVHRVPFIVIAQDLYPEILVEHGMFAGDSAPARALSALFRWAYRRATRVVSLGPSMSRRLEVKGVHGDRIAAISNWSTGDPTVVRGDENRLRGDWGLTDRFVVLYSGNLGVAHDFETPIRAVRAAREVIPELSLVFVGSGVRLAEARALAAELALEGAVQFHSFVPVEMVPHTHGLADVALVTLRAGFEGLVVPSKLYGYMARAIPTLFVGPYSDVAGVLNDSGGGLAIDPNDTAALARALVELARDPLRLRAMGEAAVRYYERHYAREIGLRRYGEVLRSVLG